MKTYFTLSLLLVAAFSFSQDDACKLLLKRSSVSIHKAQKEMIANKRTDAGGKLAQAVRLQTDAIRFYNEKKEAQSACTGLQARKLAWEIIKEASNREDAYATATDEEKKLSGNCNEGDGLQKDAKKSSKSDSDYLDPKSLNNSNIDIK